MNATMSRIAGMVLVLVVASARAAPPLTVMVSPAEASSAGSAPIAVDDGDLLLRFLEITEFDFVDPVDLDPGLAVHPTGLDVVRGAAGAGGGLDAISAAVAETFAITPAAARHLSRGLLAHAVAADVELDDSEEARRLLQVAAADLLAALAAAPQDPHLVDALGVLLAETGWVAGRCFNPEISTAVRTVTRAGAAATAIRLGRWVVAGEWRDGGALPLFLAALEQRPDDPLLLVAAAEQARDYLWWPVEVAFQARAIEAAEAMPVRFGNELMTEIRRRRLEGLLSNGLIAEAAAFFDSLSPADQENLWRRDERPVDGGGAFSLQPVELRAEELAAALVLQGRHRTAEEVLRSSPPPGSASQPAAAAAADQPSAPAQVDVRVAQNAHAAAVRLVELLLVPPAGDPFEDLVVLLEHRENWNEQPIFTSRTFSLALLEVAVRAGYAPIVEAVVDELSGEETNLGAAAAAVCGLSPPSVARPHLRGLEEAWRETVHDAQVRARLRRAEGPAVDAGPDPARSAVAGSLRRQRLAPFVEVPVPGMEAPGQVLETGALPENADVVRVERKGETVVAIAVSQAFDPVGEISRGGYWIHRSDDSGRTWTRALYTGLRMFQPYLVVPESSVPMIADGGLRLEVERRELDTSAIVFPPTSLPAKRLESGLVLEIPWEALERDTDDDGLTDLEEERLCLDSRDPDSDSDGLIDGDDPLPHVPRGGPSTAHSEVMGALVAHFGGRRSGAIIHEAVGETPDLDEILGRFNRPSHGPQDGTLFMVGDRAELRGVDAETLVVVLTEAELEQANEKLGPTFPIRIELLVLDRAGERAFAVWDASWTGGRLRLDRNNDGTWRVEEVGFWIT